MYQLRIDCVQLIIKYNSYIERVRIFSKPIKNENDAHKIIEDFLSQFKSVKWLDEKEKLNNLKWQCICQDDNGYYYSFGFDYVNYEV